jgi:hypothetical protein
MAGLIRNDISETLSTKTPDTGLNRSVMLVESSISQRRPRYIYNWISFESMEADGYPEIQQPQ